MSFGQIGLTITHQLSSDSPSNDAHISVTSTWAPAHFETDDTRCNFPESYNPSSECYKPLCSVLAADKTVKLWDVSLQPAYQDRISLSHQYLKQPPPKADTVLFLVTCLLRLSHNTRLE